METPPNAVVLLPDGKMQLLDHTPILTEAQRLVSGFIEVLMSPEVKYEILINEDGHILDMTPSKWTAFLRRHAFWWLSRPAVGTMVLLPASSGSLSAELVQELQEFSHSLD